ncbi:MAG: phosphoribosylglycinamide formyltransferase [Elusimicrobia bacterium]|nr:phosphoribosylglycinamide formyltransferase [Elusimicrobiota bacterium]MBD3412380.1 phosphoribosylglycinamide formyltransferase [Elusimicrobiota bacterium]
MNNRPVRIGVLVSGSGSNLQAIMDGIADGRIPNARITVVVSSKADAFALERARNAGIDGIFVNPKEYTDDRAYTEKILTILESYAVDLICLAGFLRKIDRLMIERYRGRIMNIHPALLPRFGGKGMYGHFVHEAVIESGDRESGPTVHFVDEHYDHGPVILQKKIPVLDTDTPETLARRVLAEEHRIYVEAVKLFCEDRLALKDGTVKIR